MTDGLKQPRTALLTLLTHRPAWTIFFLALACRLLYLFSVRHTFLFQHQIGDGHYFDYYAWKIASGEIRNVPFQVTLSPVYLAYLASFYKVFGHFPLLAKLGQIFLGSLGCSLLYRIGRDIWNERVGWLAGLMAAFSGLLIFFDLEFQKPSLAIFFLILAFYFFVRAFQQQKLTSWLAAGIALTTAFVLRLQMILTVPLVPFLMLLVPREMGKKFAAGVLIFFLATIGTFAAWKCWFTWLVPHQQTPFLETGLHFYIGNNPESDGTYVTVFKRIEKAPGFTYPFVTMVPGDARGHSQKAKEVVALVYGRPVTDWEAQQYWIREALSYIKNHPRAWLRLMGKKLFLILNAYEVPHDVDYHYTRKQSWLLSLPLVSYGVIAPLGLLGILLCRYPHRPEAALVLCYLGSFSLFMLLTYINSLFRVHLYPALILFASFALWRLVGLFRERKFGRLAVALALLLLFLIPVHMSSPADRPGRDQLMEKRIERVKTELDRYKRLNRDIYSLAPHRLAL